MSTAPLEVDSSEPTSDYESSLAESDTTSLISAVKDHTYENGRRYHGWRSGKYNVPNDEEEQSRMDIYHHVLTLALGGELFKAPIGDNPQRVLDLGTGTGIWVIDFADLHPSAEVIGNDLSPIQPGWVPPNAKFEIDDIEDAWMHPADTFDFIHGRMLAGFVRDWDALCAQAFRATAPGGWVEFMNLSQLFTADDASLPETHVLRRWSVLWNQACEAAGAPFLSVTAGGRLKDTLARAGYVDVVEDVLKVPTNPWAKDPTLKIIGQYYLLHNLEGIESLTVGLFTRQLGWNMEKVKEFLEEVKVGLKQRSAHAYSEIRVTYGRKPQ